MRLFEAAREAGVGRVVFLSSRAVYGDYPAGTRLDEDMEPRPDTLYGHVKREGEAALARLAGPGFAGVSLRVTGVYGPAGPGRRAQVGGAVRELCPGRGRSRRGSRPRSMARMWRRRWRCCSRGEARSGVWNVSDIVLDRADLLAA